MCLTYISNINESYYELTRNCAFFNVWIISGVTVCAAYICARKRLGLVICSGLLCFFMSFKI